MNKIGVTEWYLPYSGPGAIRLCRKIGMDGIEIGDLGGHLRNYPLLNDAIKDEYREAMGDGCFQIYAYHAISLSRELGFKYDLNSDRGKEGARIFRTSVKICKEYGIPVVMLACYQNGKPENRYEVQRVIENLKEYVRIAEDQGVRVTLEAFSDLETVRRILEEAAGVTLCYDLLNPIKFGFGEPTEEILMLDMDKIDHIHIKEAGQTLDHYCLLGTGIPDIQESIRLLKEKGYRGWFFLENHYNEPPLMYDGQGIEAMKKDAVYIKTILEG